MKRIKTFETEKNNYTVKFGVNQLEAVEKEIGGFDKLEGNVGISEVITIFFHGLRSLDRKVTREQAGEIMDEILEEVTFEEFVGELMETLTSTFSGAPSKKAK